MHPEDAKEIAGTTRTVGYHEWVDIPNGLLYQSCADCGLSHSLMVALPDSSAIPEAQLRVRLIQEPELTDAAREQEKMSIPLYREVKQLREERLKLRKALETLKSCINVDGTRLLAINHIGFMWGTINMALGVEDGDRSPGDEATGRDSGPDPASAGSSDDRGGTQTVDGTADVRHTSE